MPEKIIGFSLNNRLFIIVAVGCLVIAIMNIIELITKKYDIHEEKDAQFKKIQSKRVQSIVLVIYNSSFSIGIIAYLIYKYIHNNHTPTSFLVFVFLLVVAPKLIVKVLNMLGKNNSDDTTPTNNNSKSTIVNEDWDFVTDRARKDKEEKL